MKGAEAMRPQTKAITTAYTKLKEIENAQDLKREGLTLYEYRAACDMMDELRKPGGVSFTFITSVAEFFKRCGYSVKLTNVNYKIFL